jgi:molecular chaperone GrpE
MTEPADDEQLREPSARAEARGTDPGDDGALETLRRERDGLQERLLRTAAEFDNYRKRIERERRERADAAEADMLGELLPIVDDLERALEAPSAGGSDAYRRGVELIHKQMTDLLRRRGVTPIEVLGKPFDPRYHQAVIHEESVDHSEGDVIAELRRGYMLGERLLRAAMVKVAKA